MSRPVGSEASRMELAREVMRVLRQHGSALQKLSYRQASIRTGGALHFTVIGNMATGLGTSPDSARMFARAFGEDEDYFAALAAGVPSSQLKGADSTLDVIDKIGVRLSPSVFASVPMAEGSVSAGGRLLMAEDGAHTLGDEMGDQVQAIRVAGDCMEPDCRDGDIILVRESDTAQVGQTVVASVGSVGSPHIKVLDQDGDTYFLRGRDGTVIRDKFRISGIVVGFVRLFD